MSLLEREVVKIRSNAQSNQNLLQRTVSGIKTETPVNFTPQQKESKLKEFFKAETGFFDTIFSPLFIKEANKQIEREQESRTKLLDLYKTLPDSPKKTSIKNLLLESPTLRFEDIIPTATKTTSQVLGEAISTALWATPLPEFKALIKPGQKILTKLGQSALRGTIYGAGYGAAYGLAEEGTLNQKKGDIAENILFGGIAGGLLDPAIGVALPSAIRGAAKVYKKLFKGETNQVVKPIIREVEKTVGEVKTSPALITRGTRVTTFDRKISDLDERIFNNHQTLDNLIIERPDFLLPKPGTIKKAIPVTDELITKQVEKIENLKKEINVLENQRTKELGKLSERSLKAGDQIFNNEVGRVTIDSFLKDNTGKLSVMGKDINGRLIYLEPDSLLNMKKITPAERKLEVELVGVAKPLEEPIVLGTPQKINNFATSLLRSGSAALNKLGDAGKQLNLLMESVIDGTSRKIGAMELPLSKIVRELKLDKKATKFTQEELKNIIDILDSGLRLKARNLNEIPNKPLNDRVKLFLETFSNTTKSLVDEANKKNILIRNSTTGKTQPIGEAFIHFPHILKDIEKFKKNKKALTGILTSRQGMTPQQANVLINSFVKNFGVNRYAGLERARTFMLEGFDELEKFGYETNPIVALKDFIGGSSKRLTEASVFGRENELVKELMNVIRESGYDESMAQEIWNVYGGSKGTSKIRKSISGAFRATQIVFKLPFGALLNATQTVNTATEFGIRNTFKGYKEYFLRNVRAKDRGMLAGVVDDVISRAIKIAGGESEIVEKYLKAVGFTSVEKMNRIVTVGAAQEWATKSLEQLKKNFNNPKLIRHFQQLGIDDIRKVLNRGRFTQEELNILGQKAVNSTQFRNSVLDIPLLWNSPEMKVATQFKSFAYQQTTFIKRVILDELAQGNAAPLITYLLISQIAGEGVKDIKSTIKGDFNYRSDLLTLERLVDNQMSVGGLGLTGDLFDRLFLRAEKPYISVGTEFIAGPTISDLGKILNSIGDLIGGRVRSGIQGILNTIPNLGALIRNLTD